MFIIWFIYISFFEAMEAVAESLWQHDARDVVFLVFSFLTDGVSLLSASLVCRLWRAIKRSPFALADPENGMMCFNIARHLLDAEEYYLLCLDLARRTLFQARRFMRYPRSSLSFPLSFPRASLCIPSLSASPFLFNRTRGETYRKHS